MAAAATLSDGCPLVRRLADDSVMDDITAEEEELLRPDWVKGNGSDTDHSLQFFKDFKVGDLVKVKAGSSYKADGSELYSAGDQGLISAVVPDEDGKYKRAVIQWTSTGRKSAVQFDAIKNHFVRVEPKKTQTCTPMLIGTTTNGYVFSISLLDGTELWAIQGTSTISGVKGSLAARDGLVIMATNRCTDRYCYRYRNQTNTLWHGNTVVRFLRVDTGVEHCSYVPRAPVWNMVPTWGPLQDQVFFQDQEGTLYSVNQTNCEDIWGPAVGEMGTFSEGAAVYDWDHNVVVTLGMMPYTVQGCNPYVAPGILPICGNWNLAQGIINAYNASSGRQRWAKTTPHPPASATVGRLGRMGGNPHDRTRFVITMGFNCFWGSQTRMQALNPNDGVVRWDREGPTLWSSMCAGDYEGGDIRRATGGRSTCQPGSWSAPIVDSDGDIFVGLQVGTLQRWGSVDGTAANVDVQSSLTTGVAFQDLAFALAPGFMAVSTCTSLIVFQVNCSDNVLTDNLTYTR